MKWRREWIKGLWLRRGFDGWDGMDEMGEKKGRGGG